MSFPVDSSPEASRGSRAPRGRGPRALVLRTAGTNCDRETLLALELAGASPALAHVRRLMERPEALDDAAMLVIPGGFSYGDDVAAGRVLGYELRRHLAEPLAAFVERGGIVLGVCNGFQVLVDTGLLEDARPRGSRATEEERAGERAERDVALAGNASNRFECRWTTLRSEDCACPWLVPGEIWPAPVAHGEGRFLVRDRATLERLRSERRIALRYVRADGSPARGHPDDPNGSVEDIAGICDASGRVLGLMPHPERNVTPWHHPLWTRRPPRAEGEGLSFYRRMVRVAAEPLARAGARTPAP